MRFRNWINKKLEKDEEFRRAYDALEPEYAIRQALIELRHALGLTQGELAQRLGTQQSVISRLERGERMPNLETLLKYARAIDKPLTISLIPHNGAEVVVTTSEEIARQAKEHRKAHLTPA